MSTGWPAAPVVYEIDTWPWLEGVSSRNATTRFKGYRPFAQVRRALRAGKAQEIAEKALEELLPQMGGA